MALPNKFATRNYTEKWPCHGVFIVLDRRLSKGNTFSCVSIYRYKWAMFSIS